MLAPLKKDSGAIKDVCRPAGAHYFLCHVTPALPRGATTVSRLRRWFRPSRRHEKIKMNDASSTSLESFICDHL
jgi:hypothetical protein